MTVEHCPECAKRPYLCFEHNEEQRAREEDELTLRIFDGLWRARLQREQRFAEKLAKDAFYWGRKVAKGEMLLSEAQAAMKRRAWKVDETMPLVVVNNRGDMQPMLATVLHYQAALTLALDAFDRGYESITRRRA